MIVDAGFILAGFALLTFAADRLVVSSARIALKFGLSSVLIGAVVVGLGTSLPEMLVSGLAAARPDGIDFALGNIVGSNIANLSLVLGTSALISPIARQPRTIKREGGLMFLGSLLLTVLAWDGVLSRSDGITLVVGIVVALGLIVRWSMSDSLDEPSDVDELGDLGDPQQVNTSKEAAFALLSLGLTLLGAELLVRGASDVAEAIGISDAVISLTLVAIGTSLPEFATAIAAARRDENDLVLGNVLGSNIFNALGVGGLAGIVGNASTVDSFRGPLLTMMAVTAVTGLLAYSTKALAKPQGLILLFGYPLILLSI